MFVCSVSECQEREPGDQLSLRTFLQELEYDELEERVGLCSTHEGKVHGVALELCEPVQQLLELLGPLEQLVR